MTDVQRSITGERQVEKAARRSSRARYALVPPVEELREMRGRNMTHQQIADEIFHRTGERVTRNAVTMALGRAGVKGTVRRYDDLIPWRVKPKHEHNYHLAMLRFEARRRRELPLTESQVRRLDGWLRRLEEHGMVIYYEPDSPDGFYLLPRQESDTDIIRHPESVED